MTFFQTVDSVETRALALPHMLEMLRALANAHELSREKDLSAVRLWWRVRRTDGGKNAHMDASITAGFVEDVARCASGESKLRLTAKGWAALGRKLPFWMEGGQ